jgi:alkylation response protein AidB-like acyl-CoA dehydrogenase
MASYLNDNPDLLYYLDRGIDWSPLVELTELGYRTPDGFKNPKDAAELYKEILGVIGQFVAEEVAPHTQEIDREGVRFAKGETSFGPRMDRIFESIAALELHGMCLPRELGGQSCPIAIFLLASELFARADISVMTHYSFHGGIAMAMLVYSLLEGSTEFDPETGVITKTRWADAIEEIRTGKAWGAMDITEPNAGSDMAQLRTVGEQDEKGNWFVTGNKIFITSGHGKYHFVIARTEKTANPSDPFSGLGGLSMFLVKMWDDLPDGTKKIYGIVDRIEEKMGHHGSATCSVQFERSPAELVGKRGEGFKMMLTLMNNARIGVGFESLGLCETAYRMACAYAAERKSMGKTIDRHEMIADYLDEMQTDIQGIRALAVHCLTENEIAQKEQVILKAGVLRDPHEIEKHQRSHKRHARTARRLTPLLKYLAAEKAVEMARTCVQIHGGVGYTKEFGAEKLLRDAMVMPIYEGTSQIQSLMVMKDTLTSALKNPQRFARRIAQARWKATASRDPLERRVAKLQALSLSSQQHLITKTAADKFSALRGLPLAEWPDRFLKNWDPKRDFAYAMLHAERLTRQLADEAICELLLSQAQRHPERREVLERYLERAEPRARYLHDRITSTGQRLLDELAEKEGAEEKEAV